MMRNGFLTSIDGPLSGTNDSMTLGYDGPGRINSVTRSEGPAPSDTVTLSAVYDALDRPTSVTYPDGTTTQNVYSRLDLLRSKDRLGRWTGFVYNALGKVAEVRDPAGRTTKYEWCRCGALQGLTDPMGRLTKWAYDIQGRMISKTFADSSHDDYLYEPSTSRLSQSTDTAGNVRTVTDNLDNTPSGTSWTAAPGFAPVNPVSLTWDPNYRRIQSVSDASGPFVHAYNPFGSDPYVALNGRGRLASVDGPLANDTQSFTYDELGRTISTQIDGSANQSSVAYNDPAGRATSWTNNLGTFTPTYVNPSYGVGRVSNIAYPNGQATNYQWENNAGDFRLKQIQNLGAGGAPLSKFDYVTDAAGRIAQWTLQRGSANAERYDFGYNADNELTSAVLKSVSTGTTLKQFYYGYDDAGNRLSEQVDGAVRSATYNSSNQLTARNAGGLTRFQGTLNEPGTATVGGQPAWMSGGTQFQANVNLSAGTNNVAIVAKDANNNTRTNNYTVTLPAGGAASFSYDSNGNMLSDGTKSYTWDAANRLVKITYAGGSTTEIGYDAMGRWSVIREKDSLGAITGTRQFALAEQRDAANAVVRRYYPEGFTEGTNKYFYTRDHLGSVREVVDGTGAQVAQYDYGPYGRVTKLSGSVDSDMLYTGHYAHAGSGLALAPFRAYDSELGRWLSRDPIAERGGLNLYGYVGNDTTNLTDPSGLEPVRKARRREGFRF